ncbi:MAG: hypothetical protein ABIA62_06020 [Candidatus Woesearchaeota archaeon]
MIFEDFITNGKVVVGEKDLQKAKAVIKMSDNNLKAANMLDMTETTASTILSISYESIRQILEAMCLKEGYKVYSHEAFTAYLKSKNEEQMAEEFDRLRKLRNGINYYGKQVSTEVSEDAKKKIKKLCDTLKNKYLSALH